MLDSNKPQLFDLQTDQMNLNRYGSVSVNGCHYNAAFDPSKYTLPTDVRTVGVYHQPWQEWLGGRGRFKISDLPAHDLALLGDVHVHREWIPGPDGRGPKLALSSGPLRPCKVDETEYGMVWLVREDLTAESVVLPWRRKYLRLQVRGNPDQVLAVVAAAHSLSMPPAVLIEGAETVKGFEAAARKAAEGNNYLIGFRRLPLDNTPVDAASARRQARSALGDALAARLVDDPAASALACRLADSSMEPNSVLDEMGYLGN
jgi:hypothetical protein